MTLKSSRGVPYVRGQPGKVRSRMCVGVGVCGRVVPLGVFVVDDSFLRVAKTT